MVDFAREKPIDVTGLADLMNVNPVTVRRWFKRGLDHVKLGGKVFTTLEALNRFGRPGDSPQMLQVRMDSDTLAAIKSLSKEGFKFGREIKDASQVTTGRQG